jgi:AbiV family abortive infection protein
MKRGTVLGFALAPIIDAGTAPFHHKMALSWKEIRYTSNVKPEFLELYKSAHNNAVDLLAEAEILYEKEKSARAFFLAFTALEEIFKSQLAADVFTGLIDEKEFFEYYRDHKKKIRRMAWATDEARRYFDKWEDSYVELEPPAISSRMNALYVSLDKRTVQSPKQIVTAEEAKGVIRTVEAALDSIAKNEFMGYPPGTKGYMK